MLTMHVIVVFNIRSNYVLGPFGLFILNLIKISHTDLHPKPPQIIDNQILCLGQQHL